MMITISFMLERASPMTLRWVLAILRVILMLFFTMPLMDICGIPRARAIMSI